ncbi:MAG: hypothetical protein HFI09_05065 [Bacilli bacterium]|nr:hypothetical protein [Bacilli bacterium]
MQYYTVEDIKVITGAEQNKAYEIIRNLNKKYKKKFPECELLQGKVAKWYFHEAMGLKEGVEESETQTKIEA